MTSPRGRTTVAGDTDEETEAGATEEVGDEVERAGEPELVRTRVATGEWTRRVPSRATCL